MFGTVHQNPADQTTPQSHLLSPCIVNVGIIQRGSRFLLIAETTTSTMNELVSPSVPSRPPPTTTRVDRIRERENEKQARHLQMMSLKTSVLPLIFPTLTIPRDAKCTNCDVEKKQYTKLEDWFTEPEDALMTPFPGNQGWRPWINMWLLRRKLASSMDSLAVHPAHVKMLHNIQLKSEKPLVFVVQSRDPALDVPLIQFVLQLFNFELPLTVFDGKSLRMSEMREFHLENAEEVSESQLANHLRSNGKILLLLRDNTSNSDDLKKILDAYGFHHEMLLLPVSISSENPRAALTGAGIVKINFHEPYTVGDLIKAAGISEAERTKRIADHLKFDIALKRPVMSTNVVAFLMLTRFRNGTTAGVLAESLLEFKQGSKDVDFGFEGETEDVIEHAVDLLGDHLIAEGDVIKLNNEKIVHLTEFSEPLLPHFALESILVVSALSLLSHEGFIDYNTLMSTGSELCEVLQLNIPLKKPCEDFRSVLDKAFDRCSLQDVMRKPLAKVVTDSEQRAMRMARHMESDDEYSDDDGYQSRNPENEVTMNESMKEKIEWLKNVTLPTLDAYLSVVYTMKALGRGEKISKKTFLEKSLKVMREELEDGNCKYWESCSPLWMEQCIDYLVSKGAVDIKDGKLSYGSKTRIQGIISQLQKFFPEA